MSRRHVHYTPPADGQSSLFAPSATALGMQALQRTATRHAAEIQRLVPLAQRLAEAGPITTETLRRAAGLWESRGRELSYLGAVMKAAGLVPTGAYRRSELPASHGNLIVEWRKP
jgi:hypothetical protein